MNCKQGDYAFVIREIPQVKVGTVVRVNSWAVVEGRGQWDVEAPRGLFFYAHDDDLYAMKGDEIPTGCRSELFDPHWIYSDGGKPRGPGLGGSDRRRA